MIQYFNAFLIFAFALVVVFFAVQIICKVLKINLSLRDDWRNYWKWLSTWLTGLGVVAGGALIAFPNFLIDAWTALPVELKSKIPENYTLLLMLAVFVAGQFAKIFKQEKKQNDPPNTDK